MTKLKKELLRLYKDERARGFQARWAVSNARTRIEWDKHEVAEYSSGEPIDPKRGNVRLRFIPDDTCSLEDLEGDCFNPKVNPDVPASRLERDRKVFIEKVNAEGVWGVIGEYFDGEKWQHADSCFGFVGDDWKYSGCDTDIMQATLNAAQEVRVCRCCGRPLITKMKQNDEDRTTLGKIIMVGVIVLLVMFTGLTGPFVLPLFSLWMYMNVYWRKAISESLADVVRFFFQGRSQPNNPPAAPTSTYPTAGEQTFINRVNKATRYICQTCEQEVLPDHQFCHKCGKQLNWVGLQ